MDHPFRQSIWNKSAGIAAFLLVAARMYMLLVIYGNVLPATAIADSLFYTGALALAAYFYWYVTGFIEVFQSKIIIALAVQLICLAITLALLSIFELENLKTFSYLIPIRMSVSILTWIILQQWYDLNKAKKQEEDEQAKENSEVEPSPQNQQDKDQAEAIDQISVKNGSKIHIIKNDELIYIQAYGDYVSLFTKDGKYVKELTMKYLEANLPKNFIRIHRSYIVNTSYIIRVELFGKETYQLRLKDNTCLRISSSGYKLLKEKLML